MEGRDGKNQVSEAPAKIQMIDCQAYVCYDVNARGSQCTHVCVCYFCAIDHHSLCHPGYPNDKLGVYLFDLIAYVEN